MFTGQSTTLQVGIPTLIGQTVRCSNSISPWLHTQILMVESYCFIVKWTPVWWLNSHLKWPDHLILSVQSVHMFWRCISTTLQPLQVLKQGDYASTGDLHMCWVLPKYGQPKQENWRFEKWPGQSSHVFKNTRTDSMQSPHVFQIAIWPSEISVISRVLGNKWQQRISPSAQQLADPHALRVKFRRGTHQPNQPLGLILRGNLVICLSGWRNLPSKTHQPAGALIGPKMVKGGWELRKYRVYSSPTVYEWWYDHPLLWI